MNAEQQLVKDTLEPMFIVCDFLNDFLQDRINYYNQKDTNSSHSLNYTHALQKLTSVRQKLAQFKLELLDTDALDHRSLDAVSPVFLNNVKELRGDLMKLLAVQPKF